MAKLVNKTRSLIYKASVFAVASFTTFPAFASVTIYSEAPPTITIPEPGTLSLMAMGIAITYIAKKRKK